MTGIIQRTFSNQALRFCSIAVLLLISLQSRAADDYYDYIADFHLHESHQARNPNHVIQYGDSDEGQLLRFVLDPNRATSAVNRYFQSTKRGESIPDLPKLLQPLIVRYELSFKDQPLIYEAEYLDSLDITIAILASGSAMTSISSPAVPANNKSSTKTEAEQKAFAESANALGKMARELSATVYRAIAAELRKKVEKGMFSDEGARRALAIADKLAPL